MATFTENYNLIKPGEADYYDVQDFNENMEVIDTQMKATAAEVEDLHGKIGTYGDTNPETVFGQFHQLEGAFSAVKSIQHLIYTNTGGQSRGIISIQPVNPERCFVHWARMIDVQNRTSFRYTLEAEKICFTHDNYVSSDIISLDVYIIEFY